MSHPERSAERDAALMALLPFVELDGWTEEQVRVFLREQPEETVR